MLQFDGWRNGMCRIRHLGQSRTPTKRAPSLLRDGLMVDTGTGGTRARPDYEIHEV